MLYKEEAYRITGACMEVHKELGCGFLEAVYQEALGIELENRKIPFVKELPLEILYKSKKLNKYYIADFVCFDAIILELKALSELTSQHEAQVLNYLKATNIQLGILVNFGQTSLQFKRIIRTKN